MLFVAVSYIVARALSFRPAPLPGPGLSLLLRPVAAATIALYRAHMYRRRADFARRPLLSTTAFITRRLAPYIVKGRGLFPLAAAVIRSPTPTFPTPRLLIGQGVATVTIGSAPSSISFSL